MAKDNIISMSSIDRSPIINIGGIDIVDLTKGLFSFSTKRKIGRKIIIDKSLAGKPHLISKAIYQSQNMVDLLFSYNGYSNPMTVAAGDVLYVPTMKELKKSIIPTNTSVQTNKSIELLKKRTPEIDKKRIKFLMNSSNNFGEIKTPNMNESSKQFIVDSISNKILLGSDGQPQNIAVINSIESIKKEITI